MKKLLFVLLLGISPLMAQTDLKGSKIIGVGGAGSYGNIQGFVGSLQLETGYFLTNRLYIGADFSYHRVDYGRRIREIQNRYHTSNSLESPYLINRSIDMGINARYFITTGNVKLYTGLGAGLYHYFPANIENSFAQKSTLPYIKGTLGIMNFFGKKDQFFFNSSVDLIQYGRDKNNSPQVGRTQLSGKLNIGFGLRF